VTVVFAWICAGVAAVATLGAAYFFDKSADEGIERARHEAAAANERAALLEKDATTARLQIAQAQARAPARIESRPAVGAYVSARGCGLPDIWKGTVPRMRGCATKSAVLQKRCEPLGSAIGK
jgi:hypothetical protein